MQKRPVIEVGAVWQKWNFVFWVLLLKLEIDFNTAPDSWRDRTSVMLVKAEIYKFATALFKDQLLDWIEMLYNTCLISKWHMLLLVRLVSIEHRKASVSKT